MRKNLAQLSLLFFVVACSSSALLEIPPVSNPPVNWSQFSTSTFPGSNCPTIAGEYSEPPVIYQSAENSETNSKDETGSYYGHFPFHLADRKELTEGEISLAGNQFLIRQSDADNFYFLFVTNKKSIVEYHFAAEEGDFECKRGYIEFPVISSFGMIEGMSVNSQNRNVVFRDNKGALIVEKTTGPYRGNPSTANSKFRHEYLQYPLNEGFPKVD